VSALCCVSELRVGLLPEVPPRIPLVVRWGWARSAQLLCVIVVFVKVCLYNSGAGREAPSPSVILVLYCRLFLLYCRLFLFPYTIVILTVMSVGSRPAFASRTAGRPYLFVIPVCTDCNIGNCPTVDTRRNRGSTFGISKTNPDCICVVLSHKSPLSKFLRDLSLSR
jgi:hypothetical protein